MKDKTFYIVCGIIFIVLFLIIILTSIIYDEKQKEVKKKYKNECDAYFTIESWAWTSEDCYESRFQNRMKELNKDGTFCFMDNSGEVRLKCSWSEETSHIK